MSLLDAGPDADNQPNQDGGDGKKTLLGDGDGQTQKAPEVQMPEWLNDASEPLKGAKSLYKFKDRDSALKSYLELEGKLGKSVEVPGKDATREEWAKFYHRIGKTVPTAPDEYEVPVEDSELSKRLRAIAFEQGLTKEQAKAQASAIAEYEKEREKLLDQKYTEDAKKADRLLRERFGAQYDVRMGDAKRAYETLFPEETRAKLRASGMSNDPNFISVMSDLGLKIKGDVLVKGDRAADTDRDPYQDSMKELLERKKRQ